MKIFLTFSHFCHGLLFKEILQYKTLNTKENKQMKLIKKLSLILTCVCILSNTVATVNLVENEHEISPVWDDNDKPQTLK